MSQAAVYVALYGLGVAFHLAFGPRDRPGLCGALGFLTGLAVWALAALVVIASPLRYDATSAAAAYAIPLASCALVAGRRWRPRRGDLLVHATWLVGFTLVVLWLCSFDASRFSPDSRNLVIAGLRLGDSGAADLGALSTRGVLPIVAHSLATFTTDDYAWALSSVVGLSIAPVFVAIAWRVAPRTIVVIAAAVVITTYNVTFHLFYIHTNLGAAAYLLVALGLVWLAETERDVGYLPGAMIALLACTLHRIEGPVFAAIVIVVGMFPSTLPRCTIALAITSYALPCALWYVQLARVPESHLTASIALGLAAGTAALAILYVIAPPRILRHAPRILAGLLVLALIAGALLEPEAAAQTGRALRANLFDPPLAMWGPTWYVVIALAALSLLAPPLEAGRVLSYGAACTALAIVVLGVRHPYRSGVTDSANRMMLQVLPVALLYLTLQLAPLLRRR